MATCSVYKNGLLLGTGSITNGATSVTGFTVTIRLGGRRRAQYPDSDHLFIR
jgi:hypothetical protein